MSRYDPDLRPVRSAMTLRLWPAGFGLVVCAAGAAVCFAVGDADRQVGKVADARRNRRGGPG